MQATTLDRIIPIAADVLNLDACHDRSEILSEIDKCRHLMFSGLGPAVREAFFIRNICEPIRVFTKRCGARCADRFLGFSLPPDCVKAEVFKVDGERIEVASRFSGSVDDYQWGSLHCPKALNLGNGFSLPCDPEGPFNLGFRLDVLEKPKGELRVGVKYVDLNGHPQREDVLLSNDLHTVSQTVDVLSHRGISLPPGLDAMVEVWVNGEMMTQFHPSIAVPDYTRYAVTPVCQGEIEIQDALFEPQRAIFDSDVIETGDPNFWQSVLQWKDLHFKTKRNGPEQNSYQSLGAFLVQHGRDLLEMKESASEILIFEPDNRAEGSLRRINDLRNRRYYTGR